MFLPPVNLLCDPYAAFVYCTEGDDQDTTNQDYVKNEGGTEQIRLCDRSRSYPEF